MNNLHQTIETTVLAVHRRNGGTLAQLDFDLRFLDPAMNLDSLDLAEIIVALEKEFRCSPFAEGPPPRTRAELARKITAAPPQPNVLECDGQRSATPL